MYVCCTQKPDSITVFSCFSGPLFSFDVHEDIRLINDASVERDDVC